MAENTGIQWATHTFNPWWGCMRVSPGCEKCYAETLSNRRGLPVWGPPKNTERKAMSEGYWREPLKWQRRAEQTGFRPRVFPSMCDPFEDHWQVVPWRRRFLELVEATPAIDWLLLTKRPENVMGMVPQGWRTRLPSNVWIGMSAENQEWYERRIGHLCRIPATIRFISAEPLLGPIDFGFLGTVPADWGVGYTPVGSLVDWVIFGGESGPGARGCDVAWVRHGVTQCAEAGVAPFVKQLGADPYFVALRDDHPDAPLAARSGNWPVELDWKTDPKYPRGSAGPVKLRDRKGGDEMEWPPDLRVRQFPEGVQADPEAHEDD